MSDDGGAAAAAGQEPGPEPNGGGDAGAAAAALAGGGQSGGTPADWRSALPEALRTDPTLANIDSIERLAQDHVNAQSLLGRKGAVVPKEGDPPEMFDEFFKAAGRPEAPDGYDLGDWAVPEGVTWPEGRQEAILGEFHKLGLTPAQVNGALGLWAKLEGEDIAARSTGRLEGEQAVLANLKTEHGEKMDEVLALAKRGGQAVGLSDQEIEKLAYHIGDTALINKLAKVGQIASGDGGLIGGKDGGVGGISTPDAARAEVKRIRGEARRDDQHPLYNAKHPEHKALNARVGQLTRMYTEGGAS